MKKILLVIFLLSSSVSFAFRDYPHKVDFLPPEYSVPRKVKCNSKTYDIIMRPEFSMLSDEEICRIQLNTFRQIDISRKRFIKDIICAVAIYIFFCIWILVLLK